MAILSHPSAALMNSTAATNDQAYVIISNHMSACYGNRSRGAGADAINIVDVGGPLTTGILHVGSASYWSTATSGLSRLSSSCITLNQIRLHRHSVAVGGNLDQQRPCQLRHLLHCTCNTACAAPPIVDHWSQAELLAHTHIRFHCYQHCHSLGN